jgi:hypothetical protein
VSKGIKIKKMKKLRLKVVINKPVSEVFQFTTNPKNTPLWVGSVIEEQTNEWPVKVSSVYKNTSDGVNWSEYIVSKFEKDKIFVFDKIDSSYHVQYTFVPLTDSQTELGYYEWVDEGNLENPFTMEILEKLKQIIEQK